MKTIPFEKIKHDLLKDPRVEKAYDDLELEYALIELMMRKRIDLGLSQEKLAKKIGTKQTAISRFESGNSNPSLKFVSRLASGLDVKIGISLT